MGTDLALRIDGEDPLFGSVHLQLTQRVMGGDDLPVDIGQTDPVVVNEINGTDAAAGQGLHRVTADAADAEDCHPGIFQPFHAGFAQQQFGSCKSFHNAS